MTWATDIARNFRREADAAVPGELLGIAPKLLLDAAEALESVHLANVNCNRNVDHLIEQRDEARKLLGRVFMRSAPFVTGHLGFWEGMGDVSLDNAWDKAKAWLDANPERCVHGDINPQCAAHYGPAAPSDLPKISAERASKVPASAYKLRHLDCPHVTDWSRKMGVICLNCALTAFGLTNEGFEDWLKMNDARSGDR